MRWVKCLLLCLGHILVNLSLVFVTVSDESLRVERNYHFFKWVGLVLATATITLITGAYLIALPVLKCLKQSKLRSYTVLSVVSIFYFISLSFMLWALQHLLIQPTVMQCYAVSGQIGLVFGLLVLYDNMRGESVKDLYERCLDELDDEFELGSNRVGLRDDDVQRCEAQRSDV